MRKARSNWRDVALICRKCSKKAGGGFGAKGRKTLKKALRKELGLEKGRRARLGLVEVDCMKLCPTDAVTVVLGSEPGRMRAIPVGTPVREVAHLLGWANPAEAANDGPGTPPDRSETSG